MPQRLLGALWTAAKASTAICTSQAAELAATELDAQRHVRDQRDGRHVSHQPRYPIVLNQAPLADQ
jgi:hypothetical protein